VLRSCISQFPNWTHFQNFVRRLFSSDNLLYLSSMFDSTFSDFWQWLASVISSSFRSSSLELRIDCGFATSHSSCPSTMCRLVTSQVSSSSAPQACGAPRTTFETSCVRARKPPTEKPKDTGPLQGQGASLYVNGVVLSSFIPLRYEIGFIVWLGMKSADPARALNFYVFLQALAISVSSISLGDSTGRTAMNKLARSPTLIGSPWTFTGLAPFSRSSSETLATSP
jgi:hypothetical protein